MDFKVIGKIKNVQIIARNKSIRELGRLKNIYGKSRWRKLKGEAQVQLRDGSIVSAEVHWYEAHGIGKKEMKIKKII